MANTYTLLETITVGAAGASSVTFNSIPQTGYTDLVVRTSLRETSTNSGIALCKINAITSGYTGKQLNGNGASASSDSNYVGSSGFGMDGTNNPSSTTANTFSSSEWYFPNYTSSNYKSVSVNGTNETNATTVFSGLGAYLLSNTAAISSLTFSSYSGTFVQHSTFSLYGVSALGVTPTKAPKATGGSIIDTDGTYWYHTFLYSGTFTPATPLTCDVLVVAGGGGSGASYGGGAGGGGLKYLTAQSLSSAQTVTIGAGGAARTVGANTVFGSTTSTGGGKGGTGNNTSQAANDGGAGGSGGGGAVLPANNWVGAGGAASPSGQGNAGGNGYTTGGSGASGGGGGAGTAGGTPVSLVGGNAGQGALYFGTYYGGGGVGVSNSGVHGTATNGGTAAYTDGAPNKGAGAGGEDKAGGSGIVIVRYLA